MGVIRVLFIAGIDLWFKEREILKNEGCGQGEHRGGHKGRTQGSPLRPQPHHKYPMCWRIVRANLVFALTNYPPAPNHRPDSFDVTIKTPHRIFATSTLGHMNETGHTLQWGDMGRQMI